VREEVESTGDMTTVVVFVASPVAMVLRLEEKCVELWVVGSSVGESFLRRRLS
jgi:hypothetical protein